MLSELNRVDRMRLMQFVCSFAWADLEIHPRERIFIQKMVGRLDLDDGERAKVDAWLQRPPDPEAIDPTKIPPSHRQVFIDAIEGVIYADGSLAPEEEENLLLLKELLV
jgi:uncharacterized tellurite resistance protein B-like protein